jgi:hypothetical protein
MMTPPDQWDDLVAKDMEDPRLGYDALFAAAPPGMEREITMEKKQERYDACLRAVDAVKDVLDEVKPDVVVVISNPHGVPPLDRMYPVFGIYLSDEHSSLERTGQQPGGRRGARSKEEVRGIEDFPTDHGLADHLMRSLVSDGFDVACAYQSRTGAGVEGPFTWLYETFLPERTLPIVPFVISRYLPNQPTPARAYAVGQAMRRAIEGWKSDARVAVLASGGLSHQIIDEEFDRQVIGALQTKDTEILCSLPIDRLNRAPGSAEILNWVALAGAMEASPMTLIDYVPCYRSVAGTGHSGSFAYWK